MCVAYQNYVSYLADIFRIATYHKFQLGLGKADLTHHNLYYEIT